MRSVLVTFEQELLFTDRLNQGGLDGFVIGDKVVGGTMSDVSRGREVLKVRRYAEERWVVADYHVDLDGRVGSAG